MQLSRLPVAAPLACAAFLALAACGEEASPPPPEAVASGAPAGDASVAVVENDYGTPVRERVATLGFLNKRNNLTQDIVLKSGESRRIGNAIVKLATCERTAPWEDPPETGAFVQLFVEERASTRERLAWRKVFSGWLFRNSPSLNVVEHPVYDVWVKDCAMKFPGEEGGPPAAAASASSPAKPSGSPTAAAPTPSASPSATPAPVTSPTTTPAARDEADEA